MDSRKWPVIGILGGAGPDAAIDIQLKISKFIKQRFHVTKDQEHFGVIVNNDCQIPDRSTAINENDRNILDIYIERALELEKMGANVLIVACNTAHAFLNDIQNFISIKILNMIEETAKYCTRIYPDVKKIGVISTLGAHKSKIYSRVFSNYDLEVISSDEYCLNKVHQAIYAIKAGFKINWDCNMTEEDQSKLLNLIYINSGVNEKFININNTPKDLIIETLNNIKYKDVHHTILGCTELPLAINQCDYSQQVLIDPNAIIANSAIDYCISELTNKGKLFTTTRSEIWFNSMAEPLL